MWEETNDLQFSRLEDWDLHLSSMKAFDIPFTTRGTLHETLGAWLPQALPLLSLLSAVPPSASRSDVLHSNECPWLIVRSCHSKVLFRIFLGTILIYYEYVRKSMRRINSALRKREMQQRRGFHYFVSGMSRLDSDSWSSYWFAFVSCSLRINHRVQKKDGYEYGKQPVCESAHLVPSLSQNLSFYIKKVQCDVSWSQRILSITWLWKNFSCNYLDKAVTLTTLAFARRIIMMTTFYRTIRLHFFVPSVASKKILFTLLATSLPEILELVHNGQVEIGGMSRHCQSLREMHQ